MTDEKKPKPKATFRPMTPDEQALARALKRGAFMVAGAESFERQFAQDIHRRADASKPEISEKQAQTLRQMITRHRAKVNPASIPEAERHLLSESKGRGRPNKATRSREDLSVQIELESAAKDRDAAIRQRDDAMHELANARHQLDMVREENAAMHRQQLRIGELRSSGLLWLINRVTFHPLGFALALEVESDGRVIGWALQGNGEEIWKFSDADDDTGFAASGATLKAAAEANAKPAQTTPGAADAIADTKHPEKD
jgi:hypothetical protein